ncbi:MAG: hypothetical protein PVH00_10680 [Gemmatimonadota bacterium]|jgi:hypothetical protein
MDLKSWGVSRIVALTVVYWMALWLVVRVRNRRRIRRVMGNVDFDALEPGVLTPVEGAPDIAVRTAGEDVEMRFEGRLGLPGLLLVLGPPVALFLLRYVFLG